jgi:hypothetical protein
MGKATRIAKQLHQLLIEGIEVIPGLQGQPTDVHPGRVMGMSGDGEAGPN